MIKFSDMFKSENNLIDDRGHIVGYIYALSSSDGVVRYIGKTSRDIKTRFKEHLYEAKRGCLCKKCFWIRDEGPDQIRWGILDDIRERDAQAQIDALEYVYIKAYRHLNSGHGKDPLTNIFAGDWELKDALSAGWLSRFPRKDHLTAEENIALIRVSTLSEDSIEGVIAEIDDAYTLSISIASSLARGPNTPEHNLAISEAMKNLPPFGAHTRWHLNRGTTSPTCTLCTKEND